MPAAPSRLAGRLGPLVLLLAVAVAGCDFSRERALRNVDFSLDGVAAGRIGSVDISGVSRIEDLPSSAANEILAGILSGSLPAEFDVLIAARNPEDNPTARLARFDWVVYVNDQEAARGVSTDTRTIEPGEEISLAVPVRADLVQVAARTGVSLPNLAFALIGQEADPTLIRVVVRPRISTILGDIRAGEVEVVNRRIGGG